MENTDKLILVVDDARFARNLVKRALMNGGYENIVEAGTAQQALEQFRTNRPALTLLDITLPDNCDLTLLRQLLELDPQAKIIMNSAIGQSLIIADALDMGAKDFITKPFDELTLLNIVNSVLEND